MDSCEDLEDYSACQREGYLKTDMKNQGDAWRLLQPTTALYTLNFPKFFYFSLDTFMPN
jgi:hypothetical protein